MRNVLVKVTDVDFIINNRTILQKINLQVKKGSVVTIIGPNGAGKSTLLKIILGLIKPTSGEALIREGLVVGYMPQRLHLDTSLPLTVTYFLEMTALPDHLSAEEALENVGGKHLLNYSMHDLSGGEFQRVLLARALMVKPQLLVLDEPVQGVDVNGQKAFYELLQKIGDKWGCGMVMVSHDMHMVFSASDQVVCLNQHICCQGRPEKVMKDPEYMSLFGGQLFAPYKHVHDHSHEGEDHA